MSNLARPPRSPNYLSTSRRRPAMPARSVSGESEFSMTFDGDDEPLASGQTTPSIPNYQRRYLTASQQAALGSPADSPVSTPARGE